jgi:hypothetical protein
MTTAAEYLKTITAERQARRPYRVWSVDIFDENDESVGTATMPEHWPEVEIHWA